MIRINQIKLRPGHTEEQLYAKVAQILRIDKKEIRKLHIVKQSIDARKKLDIRYSYVVEAETGRDEVLVKKAKNAQVSLAKAIKYQFPGEFQGTGNTEPEKLVSDRLVLSHRPVIIGAGPAGLFCAYFLAMHGYQPVLLERGKDVDAREQDVEHFWATGELNPESNVQFGEGGAGTFSDGKLNTLVKDKDGKGRKVLEVFVECGAQEAILYENKPHIGTDVLKKVVRTMREKIISMGGEVRFQSQVTDICTENGRLKGVEINHGEILPCEAAVLAIGHSARNTFQMLYDREVPMEAKAFAVGLRVQHPQKLIDENQYGTAENPLLPAASYKLTAQTSYGRGVYSFCMCPGGYVVNASSEPGRLAVNGMSYSGRDGENANSAVIVSVTPEDFGSEHPLAGIEFQRKLEEKAYVVGGGKVPVQTYGEFKQKVCGETENGHMKTPIAPCIKGQYAFSDLSSILPKECNLAFVEGMEQFGRILPGFNQPRALLAGVESRTSSPVRISRDDTGQSTVKGLYPCGEGAGYAGGITSAAMDGISIAEKIARMYQPISS